jgi:hypothetical protein
MAVAEFMLSQKADIYHLPFESPGSPPTDSTNLRWKICKSFLFVFHKQNSITTLSISHSLLVGI